mmetsp:Transcript_107660/g.327287  ORF Transcript_107660/g.327287 Transcript_107660/m.327287 type:complete len:367 (-) Transcript_107660:743-1843(-)
MKRACDGSALSLALVPGLAAAPEGEAPALKRQRAGEQAGLDVEQEPETRLLVPEQTAGLVIGKQGANLKAMRESYGVRIEVLQADRTPQWAGERLVIVKGATAPRAAAVDCILRSSQKHSSQAGGNACFKMLVPTAKIANLVAEGGSIIRWLQECFAIQPVLGAEEIMGEHLFAMYGAPTAVLEAAKQVVALMDVDTQQCTALEAQPCTAQQYATQPLDATQPGYAYPQAAAALQPAVAQQPVALGAVQYQPQACDVGQPAATMIQPQPTAPYPALAGACAGYGAPGVAVPLQQYPQYYPQPGVPYMQYGLPGQTSPVVAASGCPPGDVATAAVGAVAATTAVAALPAPAAEQPPLAIGGPDPSAA